MCGQLPAPIVNGGGDSLWKWLNFRLSRARDLDLESGHTAHCHASLIDVYLRIKFHWNQRNFLWTDGRTFETHFIRSTWRSRPNIWKMLKLRKNLGFFLRFSCKSGPRRQIQCPSTDAITACYDFGPPESNHIISRG